MNNLTDNLISGIGSGMDTKSAVRTTKDRVGKEAPRKRVPFNAPAMQTDVRYTLPGYHLHWFRDDEDRVPRALAAGYVFVSSEETELVDTRLTPSNNDMGTGMRRFSKSTDARGNPVYLVLMKIPQDLYEEDQAVQLGAVEHKMKLIENGQDDINKGVSRAYQPNGRETRLNRSNAS